MTRARELMRAAERQTGLKNWGELDFLPRLNRWLGCVASDRGLSELGRHECHGFVMRHAINRLRLESLIASHPEIEDIALEPPVVVTGLPRSGTTSTALGVAHIRGLRFLATWQALQPFSGTVDERRLAARREHSSLKQAAPELERRHDCSEDAFVDDTELQCLAFGSYALEWHAHVPAWRDAYLEEDQTPVYRYLKRALQALTFLDGQARRWIIKSPQHMEQLKALSNVFPDAELIVAWRERKAAESSMNAVTKAMSQAFRSEAFPQTYWRARFDVMLRRYEAEKDIFSDRRELHVDAI